jgi:DNA polymerase-3 subunit delta
VKVQELIPEIGKAPPGLVYLFCPFKGPRAKTATFEPLLADRAVERLVATYVDPSVRDLTYGVFFADETDPADIVMEARTLPFLAERRVLLVRNAEWYNSDAAAGPLLEYLKSPCDTAMLLLIASQVDKRTKFYRACEQAGAVVECPELTDREVWERIREETEARGKAIDQGAVEELARRAGTRLSDVLNAVNLVHGYVGDATSIREEDVIAACADVAEEVVWTLTDAIASSQMGAALGSLHKLIDMGKHGDELLGTINWLLKSAYAVALGGPAAAALSPFVVRKVAPLAKRLGIGKLRDAFVLCTDTHFMTRTTGVDSTLALELLVIKLAAPRRQPGAAAGA